MSIALSTIIKPSKMLFRLLLMMCAAVFMVGVYVAFCLSDRIAFTWRILAFCICFSGAIFAFLLGRMKMRPCRIDISDNGQIRLLQQSKTSAILEDYGNIVQLSKVATLWPRVMFLCFESKDTESVIVTVFPDSVSSCEFRALSVACRWIIGRGVPPDELR